MNRPSTSLLSLCGLATCALLLFSGCLEGDVGEPVPGNETTTTGSTTSGGNTASTANTSATSTSKATATTTVCDGCINSREACVKGDADSACGVGGIECVRCDLAKGEACGDENTCVAPPSCDQSSCNGCCDGNTCVPTPTDAACGSKGAECQDCTEDGGTCSTQKLCEPPCGPETCPGCCNADGACVSGDSKAVCGSGGNACAPCTTEQECEVKAGSGNPAAGQCVDMGCAASCGGCCDGDKCLAGGAADACGSSGGQCQDCGSTATCGAQGKCEPKSAVTWDLMLLQGKFPEKDPKGKSWDVFGGNPDPFVRAFYTDPVTGKEVSKKSSADSGSFTPKWNEALFKKMNAQEVLSDLKFDYLDDDVTSFNDVLGEDCELDDSNVLFDEKPHTVFCGQIVDAQGMVTYAGGQFSVQLKRN